MEIKKIIYTDLDGTLLDSETYSWNTAEESLHLIKTKNIPLVVCTSKTRSEIEYWREQLNNAHPFISENGGGIFIPVDYFDFRFDYERKSEDYLIIELGVEYDRLVSAIKGLKKKYKIKAFHEMEPEEVARDAGLTLQQAKLAKKREFDEVFKILDKGEKEAIFKEIERQGLNYTAGGRYYHIMGDNDKGKAVALLTGLLKNQYGRIITVGIGDSENDFEMLDRMDRPYLVMKKDGGYASDKYEKAGAIGPVGWNKVIKKEIMAC